MDPELIKWMAQLGVGGALAGMMFFFYRQDHKDTVEALRSNTAALLELTKAIGSRSEGAH